MFSLSGHTQGFALAYPGDLSGVRSPVGSWYPECEMQQVDVLILDWFLFVVYMTPHLCWQSTLTKEWINGDLVSAGAAEGKFPAITTASKKAAAASPTAASPAASTAGVAPQQGHAAAAVKDRPAVTEEDISKWIQLPRQGSKGRGTCGAPSAEEPWQVGSLSGTAALSCAVLCCAARDAT